MEDNRVSLLPESDWPMTKPFWASCNENQLSFPRCKQCGKWQWYPTYFCPVCEGDVEWVKVSNKGTLYSWTKVTMVLQQEYKEKVPYIAALIDIDDAPGVRLIVNTLDLECESQLKAGMKMDIVFERLSDEINMPRCVISKEN